MHKNIAQYIKILIFTLIFVILDQYTKYLAVIHLKGKNEHVFIKNILSFNYLDGGNDGAAWGIFSGKTSLFIILTVIACFIFMIFIRNCILLSKKDSLDNHKIVIMQYLLSLLMAGALGNFIDRLIHGYVIDFICFKFINFPIFNVADCYVTVSCVFIVILCLFFLDEQDFNRIFTLHNKKRNHKG